jgi:hypothetical protein
MMPAIGPQERYNRMWLEELHAGIKPTGHFASTHEWLFDLRDNGRLAEVSWDGYIKGRKLGTYKIEELIETGKFSPGSSPLDI